MSNESIIENVRRVIVEKERQIPICAECSVLVVGGGVAGVSAAIAAARGGSDVILLEREYGLGGLATLGLVTIYLPLCDGRGHQVVYGLGEELLRLSIKHGAEKDYPEAWLIGKNVEERKRKRFMTQYNPHMFALELERLVTKLGIRILYGSVAVGTEVEHGRIQSVIIENKSGRSGILANSVIDCTGDADICRLSGAKIRQYEAGNGLANWYYYVAKGKINLQMLGLADVLPEQDGQEGKVENRAQGALNGQRYTGIDGEEISRMVIEGHQYMYTDILKKRENQPDLVPVTTSMIPMVRMTCCMEGSYSLCDNEKGKFFEDSIGMIGDWRKRGPVYEIPFRCLHGKEIKNLLTAGRCISVSDDMWDITRVIPACVVTGEAAGNAAAMCSDFEQISISELQKKILFNGGKIHFSD